MATLHRHLGVTGAVTVGLAAMIGGGVFYVWAPAAAAAGTGLLAGLVIAGVIASLNALSSAQLAMAHPVSGGAYAFGRENLGPWWGFAAGWLFLAGKTASAGAIALIAGGYLWPDAARPVAVAAVVVLGLANVSGIRTTARMSATIVAVVVAGLLVIIAVAILHRTGSGIAVNGFGAPATPAVGPLSGWYGVLQSAGMLFFCFAGYARMATLAEEVREPRRTLPRAIITALATVLVLYTVLGVLCVTILGPVRLAASVSPLADLVDGDEPWVTFVRLVAAVACFGSLLGILAGLSRTGLAMARNRDLPGALSRISVGTRSPVVAEITMGLAAVTGILILEPTRLVGFSACSVLAYYAIAHLSALRQPVGDRWLPRVVQYAGIGGCLLLALTLPWQGVLASAGWLGFGLTLRRVLAARRPAARRPGARPPAARRPGARRPPTRGS